ncbi:MAG: phosphoribosyltransferase family protein [Myxococcota bacterium]
MIRELLSAVGVVVFPPRCACELARPLNARPPQGLCEPCAEAAEFAPESSAVAPYESGGAVASTVVAAKFHRREESALALGQMLAQHEPARALSAEFDGLVPIPLSPQRYWARGFNPAESIAGVCAEQWGVPVHRHLKRVRDTRPQSELALEAREKNIRDAFEATGPVQGRFILIDDVMTSGATLRAGAKALLQAGASEVRFAVVCVSA